ncbi:peptidoglycan DD-metalloendopeptidase family protein [Bradyrhizobium sp. LHD-71]|uniref:peptidoglycan DD-metalloendopeptidase family protein n=1 Tax=Bradyrhizobium sp. LHD-71 TaxID=3072141 RepID=UPI00280DC2B9|nr:peptidoglycan DD-metalloendopeptidase family protein [Bradyrhizobium sp. LHD-71]MDQ8728823.1 peptidoglycan DD-metalloendopeptidase family protein [Bradyrhizobium sp. LHD-71]
MSRVAQMFRARRASPAAVIALVSAGLAGCSADSHRFAENPFKSRQEVTGSVPQSQYVPPAPAAPSARIESQPLPQYQHSSPPPQTAPAYGYQRQSSNQSSGISGGGRGIASYAPPSRPIETTATSAPRSIASNGSWSTAEGSTIIVGTNDTVESLAQRHNVPAREIMRANGLPSPRNLQPGQSLVIPRQVVASPPTMSAPQTRPADVASSSGGVHVVNPGETLYSIARKNNISPAALASANSLSLTTQVKTGMKLTVPGMKAVAAAPAPQQKVAAAAPPPAKPAATQPPVTVAAAELPAAKKETANLATETKEVEKEAKQDATGGLPSFRWPVRGRVIAAYGAKTSGKQNDGINLAVPEGTPVKAAEDGVVTYSGNELKGYGNLVLVRHSNGYVTAYAHASELMVKRGDTIKRGQTIAKAGQTGEVSSPQLHFEIRQGATPVDPSKFLNGT